MGAANIKLPSEQLAELKELTQESTGQKAVQKAILYFLREARQRRITEVLRGVRFDRRLDPARLRRRDR